MFSGNAARLLIDASYLLVAFLFIVGLKQMSSPVTARLTGSESTGRASSILAPSCARYWPRTSHTMT